MKKLWSTRVAGALMTVAAITGVAGCATGPDRKASDPLEPMNRAVFSFNEGLDRHVAKPVATGYTKVTPEPLRTAIGNFFSNLGDIGNFANNLLQFKLTAATEDLMRFAFNSTFGLGGLLDWATTAGLPKHHEDFGLTLGHYGVPAGPYLVLPLFGPSSVRDASGWIVASTLTPTTYLAVEAGAPLFGLNVVSTRTEMQSATDLLDQAALDKYSFVRDGYIQRRAYLLNDGKALPSYEEPADSVDDLAAQAPPDGGAARASK